MIKNAFSEHFPKSGNRTLEKCFTVEALKSGTQALEKVLPGETHSESLGRLSKTSFAVKRANKLRNFRPPLKERW